MHSLAVVIPVLNEAPGIVACLQALAPLRARGHPVVVVDGGSSDGTAALAAPWADHVISSAPGRAVQMNAGAAWCNAHTLLFLHADTTLPAQADVAIACAIQSGAAWGRFDVCIAGRSRWLPVVGALMNGRSRLTGIATGDQAIFVRRSLFTELGGYAPLPLMEDIELSQRLRQHGAPACLRQQVVTSGRRWDSRGAVRTMVLMWRLRWLYWRGVSPSELARLYR
jgi:rSAM/selenodomain-associated transferase 2